LLDVWTVTADYAVAPRQGIFVVSRNRLQFKILLFPLVYSP
jgi:hypothetical protein